MRDGRRFHSCRRGTRSDVSCKVEIAQNFVCYDAFAKALGSLSAKIYNTSSPVEVEAATTSTRSLESEQLLEVAGRERRRGKKKESGRETVTNVIFRLYPSVYIHYYVNFYLSNSNLCIHRGKVKKKNRLHWTPILLCNTSFYPI